MKLSKKNKKSASLYALLTVLVFSLCGCALPAKQDVNPLNVAQLENVNQANTKTTSVGGDHLRVAALKQAALTLGAQAGLAWRSKKIDAELEKKATYLRNIFNFDALILDHNVLPPVLTEGDQTLNLNDPQTIRLASKTYKIVQNAQFVTAPPTWRTYLFMDYNKPELPDKTLLPENAAEQQVWQQEIQVGWESGVRQADTIYAENLAELRRDYEGMILYRKLLAKHMVTPPYVATTRLGVTGDKNQININDQVLRISALSALQTDPQKWKAIVDTRSTE